MINAETLQQELEHERQLNKIDDTSGDTNPYKRIDSKQCRENRTLLAQMGTVVNFKQHATLHTVQ